MRCEIFFTEQQWDLLHDIYHSPYKTNAAIVERMYLFRCFDTQNICSTLIYDGQFRVLILVHTLYVACIYE